MTAIAELDSLIQLLEARIPANPNSPKNQRLRGQLKRELAKYFRTLSDAFPYHKLDELYSKYVKESLGSETRGILDPLLATFDDKLEAEISGQLAETYISGQAEMITWGKTKAGIPIAYEGPPISQAVDWAKVHSATLVKGMNAESRERLAYVIGRGIDKKRGIPGLSQDLRKVFTDMGKYRSELIARTETATALSQASLDTMSDMGIEGKEWVTSGDALVSPECEGNEAEGVIPVNQSFSGGVMAPPQHPDCRCVVAPARLPPEKVPVKPEPPPTQPPIKVQPPPKAPEVPMPTTKGVSPEMKNLIDNKFKVTGKVRGDIDGLRTTLRELKAANLPDSHLATVRSIELNAAKVQKVKGAMAYCDGGNNIVLAGKIGHENVVHEIGHAVWKSKVFVPDKVSKVKYNILDVFNASTKTGKGFVSSYARTNVDEFFAESYAAFAKNSKALTKLNPSMGKILKGLWK